MGEPFALATGIASFDDALGDGIDRGRRAYGGGRVSELAIAAQSLAGGLQESMSGSMRNEPMGADLDELRRDRYLEAVELAAVRDRTVTEGFDYPE